MEDRRTIRLAKTMILDAMLLGAVLAQEEDKEQILSLLSPTDMTSTTGRDLLASLKDKDRKRFGKIMARRYGVTIKEGERAIPAVLRAVQLRNASEASRRMAQHALETISDQDQLGDVAEVFEEALASLNRVVEIENQLTNSQ